MILRKVKEMIAQLLVISEPERSQKIFDFQYLIREDRSVDFEEELYEILSHLALDLDDYEPNPEWRKDCPGHYYGEEKLITNIQEALQAIEALENKNQNVQNDKN